jgi:hypothetical protein
MQLQAAEWPKKAHAESKGEKGNKRDTPKNKKPNP